MKILLLLLSIVLYNQIYSQYKVDTIIKNEAYSSYINLELKQPLYVKYILYRGGGDCERSDKWVNDTDIELLTEKQYRGSKYDKGHLANAEDFAYDCHLDSLTFLFYNRIPQTPRLNRGVWKSDEDSIRKISQNDSLIVYCGGYWDSTSLVVNKMLIPIICWKVVYDIKKKRVIYCRTYTNTQNPIKEEMLLYELEGKIGYILDIK